MRICHYVKPNHNSESPHHAIWLKLHIIQHSTVNSKTRYKFNYGVIVAGSLNGRTGKWYFDRYTIVAADQFYDLLESLCKQKTRTYLVLTDSKKTLTLLNMFTTMKRRGWRLTHAVIPPPNAICRWSKDSKGLTMFDVSNIWPMPLSDICPGNPERFNGEINEETMHDGCMEHVKQRLDKLIDMTTEWWSFLRCNDLGGFSTTIGSQSFRVFRHRYMHDKILIDCHDEALRLARDCYKGARNECYYVGSTDGQFYLLDINSHYAAVMHDLSIPVKLIGYTDRASVDDVLRWSTSSVVCCDVRIKTSQPVYAVRREGSLLFPIGEFTGTLAGCEVNYALGRQHIQSVHRVAIYSGSVAFRAYIDAMWGRRLNALKSGNKSDADKYKLLLASFYGKWAQGGGYWEKIEDVDTEEIKTWQDIDWHTKEVTEYRQFGGIIQRRNHEAESRDSSPAIAACITAAGRIRLWELMVAAGLENVYYVDTDSLLVNQNGYMGLRSYIKPDALGGLRLQGIYDHIQIYSTKDYVFGTVRRHAGVKVDGIYVNESTVDQMQDESLYRGFRNGDLSQAYEIKTRKTFKRIYAKGIIGKDGRVRPIEL